MSRLIFKNYGGSFQLRIQDAEDLGKIQNLPDALWVATSIPIDSLNCDKTFLSYVDTDKNGRIRTDELKEAQRWLFRNLSNRRRLSEASDVVILDDIDAGSPEGEKILAAAKRILNNLDLPDGREIGLNEVRDIKNIMANSSSNGDGVITQETTIDADLAQFIAAIMETVGSTLDASGKPGISENELKLFLNEAEAYITWIKKGQIPKEKTKNEIMPWGKETPDAFKLTEELEEKIDQYFIQCAMVRFDERALDEMRLRQKELEEIDFKNSSMMKERLKGAPLTLPNSKGILNLEKNINPLYAECLAEFKEKVLKRCLGKSTRQLTEKQWEKAKDVFVPYRSWLKQKEGIKVEKLGLDKLSTYVNGEYSRKISKLISNDLAVADELNQLHNLEKLILYQRWLMELANNFVNFSSLYNPERLSLFEMGTLVIDGREFTFTMKVQDRRRHKEIAQKSFMYLMYLEITGRQDKDIKFEIVAAVTSGDASRLHIGRRGIFFSTDGLEWDAEVVDIVENPISIWASVRAPFRQFASLIKKQTDKFTQSRQTKLEQAFSKPSASGMARDLLLGGGIAVAALGSAFAYITKAISQVKAVHILGVLMGIAVVVVLPGMIMGFIKIRKRDMSVIFEASGWAVNTHMRLSALLGRLFSHLPCLPKGSRKNRRDVIGQFAKKFRSNSLYSRKLVRMVLGILFIVSLSLFLLYFLKIF